MRRGVVRFVELFDEGASIRVPLIQRAYAQGRPGPRPTTVRLGFVGALRDALAGEGPQPLDLDFVYGRWTDEDHVLEPLDGQQRLTTLFLLHWVVAQLEGRQDALRTLFSTGGRSNFSYRSRDAAERFFDALLAQSAPLTTPGVRPAAWLSNQSWFVQRWLRDPTVTGCLVTLDALHEALHARPVPPGAWDRLVDRDNGPVAFRLLLLRDFRLSDALYIKMNGRGKPLTDLEVFKARLEEWVGSAYSLDEPCPYAQPGEQWTHAIGRRFDGPWTDLIWRHRGKGKTDAGELDKRFQHLLRAVALWTSVDPEDLGKVAGLVDQPRPALEELVARGALSVELFPAWVETLDLLCARGPKTKSGLGLLHSRTWYDEDAHFARILESSSAGATGGVTNLDWARSWAWWAWLRAAGPPDDAEGQRRLGAWMRLVGNLAENSDLDRTDRLLAALLALHGLVVQAVGPDLLSVVAAGLDLPGLDRRQQAEEHLKAQLLLRDEAWRTPIQTAESHPYFRGSIGFLLSFAGIEVAWEAAGRQASWDTQEDVELRTRFTHQMERALALFDDHGRLMTDVDGSERLFERALLAHGSALLPFRANWSTLRTPKPTANWRRLLRADTKVADAEERRAVFGRLVAQLDPADLRGSIQVALDRARATPAFAEAPRWRRLLVEEPALLARWPNGMLRWEDGTVYVLSGVIRGSTHLELHTFALLQWVQRELAGGRLKPFSSAEYREVYQKFPPPALVLVAPGRARLEVVGRDGTFYAQLQADVAAAALPGWNRQPDGSWSGEAPFGQGEVALTALAEILDRG